MPPAQKYEKVPASTATDDDFGALGIANDTLETTIDYQRNNSSNTNCTTSHHIGQRQHSSVDNTMAIQHHGNLTSTNSSQQLMGGDSESVTTSIAGSSTIDGRGASNVSLDTIKRPSSRTSHQYDGFATITRQEWFTVIVLCFVNLINYMDRFTIAGILTDIKKDFKMDDAQSGLLQTTFVISYMVCAPIFGYMGDRYSRRWIMILGVALWSGTTLVGSYMPTYLSFMGFRALVGVGEASYSTIAPTIISDLFVNDIRSKMLAMFYFAIPVGSGFGYIVGAETAHALGDWRWALRVTPVLGVIAVVLIFLTKEPERGQHEGSHHLETTSYKEDLIDISRNKSFMLSTLGFTCVAFVTGALAWWGPEFMYYGLKLQPGNENIELKDVSFRFGAITMVSGIIGVPLGTYIAQSLKKRSQRADPIICACGLMISAPLLAGAMIMVTANTAIAYTMVFLGEVALNLNWAIVADILLYVVMPTRRSTAEAFQILISHTFGDAGSPYIIGVISEALKSAIRTGNNSSLPFDSGDIHSLARRDANSTIFDREADMTQFKSLQYALFSTSFVEILGGVFFLLTSAYILRDKSKVEAAIAESQIVDNASSQSSSREQQPQYNYAENNTDDLT